MRLAPWRPRPPRAEDLLAELDRDIKGRPPLYIDGRIVPDRRRVRRQPPRSPGRRAVDLLDDPAPVPFVPRPLEAARGQDSPG